MNIRRKLPQEMYTTREKLRPGKQNRATRLTKNYETRLERERVLFYMKKVIIITFNKCTFSYNSFMTNKMNIGLFFINAPHLLSNEDYRASPPPLC